MTILTSELNNNENLTRLDYLVGKIVKINLLNYSDSGCYFYTLDHYNNTFYTDYLPTTNAIQCLEATPMCEIDINYSKVLNKYVYVARISPLLSSKVSDWQIADTELIDRCLALVFYTYQFIGHSDEIIPFELFN